MATCDFNCFKASALSGFLINIPGNIVSFFFSFGLDLGFCFRLV
ncbi:hypothetical protein OIU76_029952 [Salix suchowensis]|uniref:Uncharacterized protein n=4 Tax=Salix TaxID=40685 RepID=A0A9Q0ZLN8_9ROSI|nr:hypothetical protein OIU76_029952 [Salix suchowensis]KAJ6402772.1 hypothetical protein OIU84_014802 [Salix udensis]KAJ6739019.1 hypothetical protein OIU74_003893 [Salix koriyanagi]KAJ6766140.1 hypothetical protein OIU79_022161 [Salix purpurea]KAJ6368614.1 hypothetical protein OIU78_001066 [Salix suchowensis]